MGNAGFIKWKLAHHAHFILLVLLSLLNVAHPQGKSSGPIIRQAPFCVDETNSEPVEEGLYHFEDILQFHQQNNSYVPVSDGKTSPGGLITKFELKGIRVEDKDSGYSEDLHNWVHITVESAISIEGLYVQAISAPWGIPFGEFIVDFDCDDCTIPTSRLRREIEIIPCIHRPALAYTHPNVFTIGGHRHFHRHIKTKFKELHFNFRYTQYPCVEHTFAQFLIVAVRDFYANASRWETYFSPIYELNVDQNPMGAYHPFYYGWPAKYLKCHDPAVSLTREFEPAKGLSEKYKVRYNQKFDNCVVKKGGRDWYTCPPGPISMKYDDDEIPLNLTAWKGLRKKYNLEDKTELSKGSGTAGSLGGVQFCADAGTWPWNLGSLNWTLPPNIKFDNQTIDVGEVVDGEDTIDREEIEDIDCEDYSKDPGKYGSDPAIEEICDETSGLCRNIHLNDCENLVEIPIPKYGKDGMGNRKKKHWDEMTFSEQFDEIAWRWGDKNVLVLHGHLLIFSVTAGFNIIAFVARYTKEDKLIIPKSSYFGIGNWLWIHIGITYVVIGTFFGGFFLLALQSYRTGSAKDDHINGPRDLCNVRPTETKTDYCTRTTGHRYLGGVCALLFLLSYVSAWRRPQTKGMRTMSIVYHVGCAYLSKLAGIGSIGFSGTSLDPSTWAYIGIIEVSSVLMFIAAELFTRMVDKRMGIQRKVWPVLEGVDVVDIPHPYSKIKKYMLPIFAGVQMALFILDIVQHYYKIHGEFSLT